MKEKKETPLIVTVFTLFSDSHYTTVTNSRKLSMFSTLSCSLYFICSWTAVNICLVNAFIKKKNYFIIVIIIIFTLLHLKYKLNKWSLALPFLFMFLYFFLCSFLSKY